MTPLRACWLGESLLSRPSYRKKSVTKPIDTDETAPADSHQSDQNGSHHASKIAPERKSRRAYKKVLT